MDNNINKNYNIGNIGNATIRSGFSGWRNIGSGAHVDRSIAVPTNLHTEIELINIDGVLQDEKNYNNTLKIDREYKNVNSVLDREYKNANEINNATNMANISQLAINISAEDANNIAKQFGGPSATPSPEEIKIITKQYEGPLPTPSPVGVNDIVEQFGGPSAVQNTEEPEWWKNVKSFGIAALCGLGQVVEQTLDCAVQTTAEVFWLYNKAGEGIFRLFGAEDEVKATQHIESFITTKTAEFVGTEFTKSWTNEWIDYAGLRTDATDTITDWTRKIEDSIGSMFLAKLPGPWAGIATAVTSEGKSAEKAYASGADFGDATWVSHVEGLIGFAKGMLLKKISSDVKLNSNVKDSLLVDGADNSFMSLARANVLRIGGKGIAEALGLSTLTSIISSGTKSLTKYLSYGKDIKDDDGNTKYKNFFEFFKKEDLGSTCTDAFFSGIIGPLTSITGIDLKLGETWQQLIKKVAIDSSKKLFEDAVKKGV